MRRLSAGTGIAKSSLGRTYELAQVFLRDGRSQPFGEGSLANVNLNALILRK